ncbi:MULTISPECIES: type II toxin-antitoxin system RelE family toxin [Arcobacteraceae]|uniref:type II toxin-antitoxin system RelE family toxin n=1 Tax=Arcobacteraceae TaxID=2808963 RepID=UPI000DEA246A|nr:hypothetical protein [Arcobacter sp. CECT 9188]RBQ26836.1 hypothetical protein CRU88_05280 [Arcobacter sp. CECT 9188]
MYKLDFHENLNEDLDKLPEDVYDEVYKIFKKLEKDYFKYSKPLYNMQGRNLQDCRKTYFYNAEYRIVSKFENDIVKIVNIIAVGKRDNFEVYNMANSRIN